VCVKSAISPSSAGGSASTCLSTATEVNKGLTVWMAIVKPPKLSTSGSRYSAGYLTIGVDESPSPFGVVVGSDGYETTRLVLSFGQIQFKERVNNGFNASI
jgi:hypothetical protein